MLEQKQLNRLLFIDIETTSQAENFSDLSQKKQKLFEKRFKKDIDALIQYKMLHCGNLEQSDFEKIKTSAVNELYDTKAPIHCEWNKIICISCGAIWKRDDSDDFYLIKITSFYDEDEKTLLENFVQHPKLGQVINRMPGKWDKNRDDFWALVGHNISVFDLPIISKRMIINGITPPKMFDVSHLKSWDLSDIIIDTKSVWSYNVFDNSTSLDLLCEIFDVPSSKDDISGEDIKNVYYKEKDLERIVKYCEKDVFALAKVYMKMKTMKEDLILFN